MKKLLLLLLFSVFAVTAVSAQGAVVVENKALYKDVLDLVKRDFGGVHLQYNNFDEVNSLAMGLSYDERLGVYEERSKAVEKYRLFNLLVPGLGSIFQGDVFGGVCNGMIHFTGLTTAYIGLIGMFGLDLAYVWGTIIGVLFLSVPQKTDEFYNFYNGFGITAIVGFSIAAVNYIASFCRSLAYASAFKKELAKVLEVEAVDISLAPYFSEDMKNGGVMVGMNIKL